MCCRDIKNPTDPELLVLPTDACLFEDEGFKWVPWLTDWLAGFVCAEVFRRAGQHSLPVRISSPAASLLDEAMFQLGTDKTSRRKAVCVGCDAQQCADKNQCTHQMRPVHPPHECRPHAEKYAADQDAFFADYVASHLKLSELGVKWDGEPYTLQPESA